MATILESVGQRGVNKPSDVSVIDDLLRRTGVVQRTPVAAGMRIDAIKRFQDIWGIRRADHYGLITPNGTTIARLNHTASPLRLGPIALAPVSKGGYAVSYQPSAPPPPYRVFLGPTAAAHGTVLNLDQCLEITGCERTDVFTRRNLPLLLKLIGKPSHNWWAADLKVRLFVLLDGSIITRSSEEQTLPCPVRPHKGALLPLENDDPPRIKYVFKPGDKRYHGRWLHEIPGLDEQYFTEKGKFEHDPEFRGFACIGYASLVWGMPFEDLAKAKGLSVPDDPNEEDRYSGEDLARYTHATRCVWKGAELEETEPQNVVDFFQTHPPGYYLVWSGTHMMVATGGFVHEFTTSPNAGYNQTPITLRFRKYKATKRLTVRLLPRKPARAR